MSLVAGGEPTATAAAPGFNVNFTSLGHLQGTHKKNTSGTVRAWSTSGRPDGARLLVQRILAAARRAVLSALLLSQHVLHLVVRTTQNPLSLVHPLTFA